MLFARQLQEQFARIGARVTIEAARELWREPQAARMEVRMGQRGEYFHLMVDPRRVMAVQVADVQPDLRHALLVVRQRAFGRLNEAPAQKFLCGHNGLRWCAAQVLSSVTSVRDARRAHLAAELRQSAARASLILNAHSLKGSVSCSSPSSKFDRARLLRSPGRAAAPRFAHSASPN